MAVLELTNKLKGADREAIDRNYFTDVVRYDCPGALPEARWSILRADVCAYCHDAPPRYGHVEGWRGFFG